MTQSRTDRFRPRQRGIASLVVVMVLFFVVSLMAAYTNRNLIFEQRTSANQSRSTASFEAAEAGVEWTLAQLNGGAINDDCTDATPTSSFQQRYLVIPQATGSITHATRVGGNWPTCVFNGGSWDCKCPNTTTVDPTAPTTGGGPYPAFRVWPATVEAIYGTETPNDVFVASRPGLFPLESTGCTRLMTASPGCLDFLPKSQVGEGTASVRTVLALRSGLAVPPSAAITTANGVAANAPSLLRVNNMDSRSGGYTVDTYGSVTGSVIPQTLPGSPPELSLVTGTSDSRLVDINVNVPLPLTAGERMFISTFGLWRASYMEQPGLRSCASPCTTLPSLVTSNPNRVMWVEGDLTLNADIGNPSAPVLLIVNGANLTLAAGVTVTGFVYLVGGGTPLVSTISLAGSGASIQGALVAEGALQTTGGAASALTVTYVPDVLDILRTSYGSWVRLGGGWRDFKANP